eukprot:TRINITY_DN21170_c0_g2_i1.p1 TRINITY_DN21170_c0_g2~~TRINITY_DN21170_c0_g2_i1.p1  ORF type:complete len:331 (+),score=98.70 TRINITY_DN21170_c0_g2_i1:49-993(+)
MAADGQDALQQSGGNLGDTRRSSKQVRLRKPGVTYEDIEALVVNLGVLAALTLVIVVSLQFVAGADAMIYGDVFDVLARHDTPGVGAGRALRAFIEVDEATWLDCSSWRAGCGRTRQHTASLAAHVILRNETKLRMAQEWRHAHIGASYRDFSGDDSLDYCFPSASLCVFGYVSQFFSFIALLISSGYYVVMSFTDLREMQDLRVWMWKKGGSQVVVFGYMTLIASLILLLWQVNANADLIWQHDWLQTRTRIVTYVQAGFAGFLFVLGIVWFFVIRWKGRNMRLVWVEESEPRSGLDPGEERSPGASAAPAPF